MLVVLAPRLEPVTTSLKTEAAQRTRLLVAARNMLAGLQSDVDQLVRELAAQDTQVRHK